MSVYKRPLRSDELYHWGKGSVSGNHKYLAKIGNRYFYTPEELKAFKQGVSGAGKKIGDNFNKLRQHVYDAAGGAAKRKAQVTAKRANQAINNVAKDNDTARSAHEELRILRDKRWTHKEVDNNGATSATYNMSDPYKRRMANKYGHSDSNTTTKDLPQTYTKQQYDRISKNAYDRREKVLDKKEADLQRKSDIANGRLATSKRIAKEAQKKAHEAKREYDRTPVGIAENAGKKVNHVKNSIDHGKKKVQDYLADRKRQQEAVSELSRRMDAAEKRGDGSVKRLNDTTRVMFDEPVLSEPKTTSSVDEEKRRHRRR